MTESPLLAVINPLVEAIKNIGLTLDHPFTNEEAVGLASTYHLAGGPDNATVLRDYVKGELR